MKTKRLDKTELFYELADTVELLLAEFELHTGTALLSVYSPESGLYGLGETSEDLCYILSSLRELVDAI